MLAQANLDKTRVNLGELDRKLQHEQAKLGTYNEDLKAYKDKCAADCNSCDAERLATEG